MISESKEEREDNFECKVPTMDVESMDETFPQIEDGKEDIPSPMTKPGTEEPSGEDE